MKEDKHAGQVSAVSTVSKETEQKPTNSALKS